MLPSINVFILLLGAIQGAITAILLLRNKAYRGAYFFLMLYLMALIVQICCKVANKVWLVENAEWFYSLAYFTPMLYGPLSYSFAIKTMNSDKPLPRYFGIHFVPFAGQIVLQWSGVFSAAYVPFQCAAQLISVVAYHTVGLKAYRKQKTSANINSGLYASQLQWLGRFLRFSFAVSTMVTVAIYLLYFKSPAWDEARVVFILLTVFVYWVSLWAFRQPNTFAVIRGERQSAGITQDMINTPLLTLARSKYRGTGLKKEESLRIVSSLKRIVANEKIHLDPNLTLASLAKAIGCQRHHLSQVLNEVFGQTFHEFVNHHRVEAAKFLLTDPCCREMKIVGIAYDTGFKSISSFNAVFKKKIGVTPSEFRQSSLDQSGGSKFKGA